MENVDIQEKIPEAKLKSKMHKTNQKIAPILIFGDLIRIATDDESENFLNEEDEELRIFKKMISERKLKIKQA